MSEYEVVERPEKGNQGPKRNMFPMSEIIATSTNGKAIRLPLNGKKAMSVRSQLHDALSRKGFKAHTSSSDDAILVWCEPKGNGHSA